MGATIRTCVNKFGVSAAALLVAACATTPGPTPRGGPPQAASQPPSGAGVYKVGNPYQVANVWYYPREQPDYDESGIASWYGTEFQGRPTANGEIFDRNAISAAHPTLPMPTNVRVTNLENGRSIVVRVNDRGPFKSGRIIDLSEAAADRLGYRINGTARVRVAFLGRAPLNGDGADTMPEFASAISAVPAGAIAVAELPPIAGQVVVGPRPSPAASDRQPASYVIPEPEPLGEVTQEAVPASTAIYIQAGAFASAENANRVVLRLQGTGAQVSQISSGGRPLYRVRIGPFQNVDDADAALAQVVSRGHNEATIIVE